LIKINLYWKQALEESLVTGLDIMLSANENGLK